MRARSPPLVYNLVSVWSGAPNSAARWLTPRGPGNRTVIRMRTWKDRKGRRRYARWSRDFGAQKVIMALKILMTAWVQMVDRGLGTR